MAAVPDPPWWRRRGEPSRGERRPLTRDAIVEAALGLLEREGLQGVSMRKLAQELGTGAASLYWHVGDKEELLSLLLDRIVGESELPEPDPEHWQEQVKEMCARAAGSCTATATRRSSPWDASRPARARSRCSSARWRSSPPPACPRR